MRQSSTLIFRCNNNNRCSISTTTKTFNINNCSNNFRSKCTCSNNLSLISLIITRLTITSTHKKTASGFNTKTNNMIKPSLSMTKTSSSTCRIQWTSKQVNLFQSSSNNNNSNTVLKISRTKRKITAQSSMWWIMFATEQEQPLTTQSETYAQTQ